MKAERSGFVSGTSSISSHSSDLRLFLASSSPRRAQLLRTIGLPFTIVPVAADEPAPGDNDARDPAGFVERLARLKAATCDLGSGFGSVDAAPVAKPTQAIGTQAIVLAADTVVWHEGQILNKPRDAAHARWMLRSLRGRTHKVLTGVCLRCGDNYNDYHVEHETTVVKFCEVSDRWIEYYVSTGEPMDKAGAYAAQGRGALLIERIEGDFWNVVGLPLARLSRMLEKIGAPAEVWWEANPQFHAASDG